MDLLEKITEVALKAGADVVGVASMDRFDDFPMQQNPRYIMPEAKSMIVLGHRTMRGSFRGAEEGTFLSHYPAMGIGYVKKDIVPLTVRAVSCMIEDMGKEAMPIGDHFAWAATEEDGTLKKRFSVPVREGFRFLGWADSPDAADAQYLPGECVLIYSDWTVGALFNYRPDSRADEYKDFYVMAALNYDF